MTIADEDPPPTQRLEENNTQKYKARMIPSSAAEADTLTKIQSNSCQQHHCIGCDEARTNFGADQKKYDSPLYSFRLTKKNMEESGN